MEKTEFKSKLGRQSSYLPEYDNKYIELAKLGKNLTQIAKIWEIPRPTLYHWMNDNQSFKNAVKIGRDYEKAWWLDQAQENLNSKSFRDTLWIMNMKLRFNGSTDQLAEFEFSDDYLENAKKINKKMASGEISPKTAKDAIETQKIHQSMTKLDELEKRLNQLESG